MYGGPPINGIQGSLPPIWGVNRGKTAHNLSCLTGGPEEGEDVVVKEEKLSEVVESKDVLGPKPCEVSGGYECSGPRVTTLEGDYTFLGKTVPTK